MCGVSGPQRSVIYHFALSPHKKIRTQRLLFVFLFDSLFYNPTLYFSFSSFSIVFCRLCHSLVIA